jgi:hypothetical protein
MARGLGIISEELETDLNWLRAIRNSFAHSINEVTLGSDGIAEAMQSLSVRQQKDFKDATKEMADKGVEFPAIAEYIFFVMMIYQDVSNHQPHWKSFHDALARSWATWTTPTEKPEPSLKK